MKILHLATYYPRTTVIKELIQKISEKGYEQIIFINRRKRKEEKQKNILKNNKHIQYIYFNKFSILDSMIYYTRIAKAFNYLEKNIDIKQCNLVHAHCFFSDGGVALKIKKKYKIEYILTIRADIQEYFKLMPHAMLYFKKILFNAKQIIYISPSIEKEVNKKLNEKEQKIISKRSKMIPNGINNYWQQESEKKEYIEKEFIEVLQISEFIKRKKIDKSINIIKYLNKNGIKAKLTLIGDGKLKKKIKDNIKNNKIDYLINIIDKIENKKDLRKIYRNCDIFIMPSIRETFGLVYIEAMSQGLPIIYKKGTGVDDFFKEEEVGIAIDKFDYKEIMQKIKKVILNYNNISQKCVEESKIFNWDNIAKEVIKIYNL